MIRLETERLILRQYEESDLPDYHRLMSDRKNMYFLSDIATDTLEESRKSLQNAIEVNERNEARRFCIELKQSAQPGKLIGAVGYELKTVTPRTHGRARCAASDQPRLHGRARAEDSEQARAEGSEQAGATGSEQPPIRIGDPMGWFILPEFQNQGYITEAAKRVLEFAFTSDGCIRVVTGCFQDNLPTQRVMAKVGFRKEAEKPAAQWHDGQMKTRLAFAINKDEYEERIAVIGPTPAQYTSIQH